LAVLGFGCGVVVGATGEYGMHIRCFGAMGELIKRSRILVALALLLAGTAIWSTGPAEAAGRGEPSDQLLAAREIAAPASDLVNGRLRLPAPVLLESDHALIPIEASRGRGAALATTTFRHASLAVKAKAVDAQIRVQPEAASAGLAIAVAMNSPGPWNLSIRSPDGRIIYKDGDQHAPGVVTRVGDLGSLLRLNHAVDVRRIDIADAMAGEWSVEIRGPAEQAEAEGAVIVGGDPAIALRGRFESWVSRVGIARVFRLESDWSLENVRASLRGPGGEDVALAVVDGAIAFAPIISGTHVLRVSSDLLLTDGSRASRTIESVFDVSGSSVRLQAEAERVPLDGVRDEIRVSIDGGDEGEAALLAAELWLNDSGESRPICWLASLCVPNRDALSLTFDRRWLAKAGVAAGVAAGTLELRAIRLHDRNGWTVVDGVDVVPLGPAPPAVPFDPREEMELLQGRTGGHAITASIVATPATDDAVSGAHALMLVHGYCSDGQPFPANHFTGQVATFIDPNAARSHDEFAQLVGGYGANFKSFGTVAHSQGGMASLHLHTFYWSGLDWATGPRLIQSVGSPYQGTPLAGNLAVLGGIFGVGCGSVNDMTPDGATAWLATIPSWARAKVWYWTTSYKDYPFSYDYCDFVSDLFLSDPDDGVIEKSKGQLPGANNMGHTDGWCHVDDMEDPPQCTDAARNAQMNANAAR
jgi:hypothetical protein